MDAIIIGSVENVWKPSSTRHTHTRVHLPFLSNYLYSIKFPVQMEQSETSSLSFTHSHKRARLNAKDSFFSGNRNSGMESMPKCHIILEAILTCCCCCILKIPRNTMQSAVKGHNGFYCRENLMLVKGDPFSSF